MSCACPSCSNLQAFSCPWHTPHRRTPRGPLRSTSTRSHTNLSEAVCALFFYVWSCAMDRRAPADGGNYKKEEEERGEELALCLPLPSLRPPRRTMPASCSVDVKLAAIAVGLRVRPRVADMPLSMQERAFRCTRSLVEAAPNRRNPNLTLLALALKKEFDESYGPAWHCVVGRSFGSYLTHSPGGFVYFCLDGGDDANLSLLLFQTHLLPL